MSQTSDICLHTVGVNCWGRKLVFFLEKKKKKRAAWPNVKAGEVVLFGK